MGQHFYHLSEPIKLDQCQALNRFRPLRGGGFAPVETDVSLFFNRDSTIIECSSRANDYQMIAQTFAGCDLEKVFTAEDKASFMQHLTMSLYSINNYSHKYRYSDLTLSGLEPKATAFHFPLAFGTTTHSTSSPCLAISSR